MNTSKPSIHLRAIEPEDLDLLYRIENDVKLWNVGATNVPYSRYTLHDYVANSSDDIYADRQVRMMVENEQHQVVGIADVVNFDPSNCRAEVGLIILNDFRRQGFGSSTLEAVADYALQVLHLHQLLPMKPLLACSERWGMKYLPISRIGYMMVGNIVMQS